MRSFALAAASEDVVEGSASFLFSGSLGAASPVSFCSASGVISTAGSAVARVFRFFAGGILYFVVWICGVVSLGGRRIWGSRNGSDYDALGVVMTKPHSNYLELSIHYQHPNHNNETMKDRKVICLFCRHNSIPRASPRTAQRWKTYPTRHEREPYVLPRLVIDLDAADSPHVKNYDDLPKDEQERNLNSNLFRRVQVRKGDPAKYLKPLSQPSWQKFDMDSNRHSTTPIDLISYALLGESDASIAGKRGRGIVYNQTGIHPQDGVLRKVQEVASTLIVNDEIRLKKTGFNFTEQDVHDLKTKIESCYGFDNLQMLISTFSTTKKGCECLAEMGDAISTSIRLCRMRQDDASGLKVPSSKILRMLNNLHLSMKSKGVEFGSSLCNRALYYAAKVGSLPAVKMYLELAQRKAYEVNFFGSQAPSELVISFLELESRSDPTSLRSHTYRKDLLALLTGYEDGLPKEGVERGFSFRSTFKDNQISHNSILYRRYIFAIAQLGLGDTLWAEWEAAFSSRLISNHKNLKVEKFATEGAQTFALAFSIAGDSNRAFEILSTIPPRSPEIRKKDHSNITRNDHSKVLRSLIYDHYKALNLSAVPEFWQRVRLELAEVPQNAEGALELLQRYLLNDYERGVQKRRVVIKKLEDGELGEMLMVWPLKEGVPLFAKALTSNPDLMAAVDEAEEGDDDIQERHSFM